MGVEHAVVEGCAVGAGRVASELWHEKIVDKSTWGPSLESTDACACSNACAQAF